MKKTRNSGQNHGFLSKSDEANLVPIYLAQQQHQAAGFGPLGFKRLFNFRL